MSLNKTEAIILRHRHFGNTSLIFTFYTRDHGKIDAVAKGIKRGISRGEGGMEVFSHVELIYYEKQIHTLRLLSHWYILNSFKAIRASPLKFAYGSYLVELVNNLVHGEEKNENIYYLLMDSLSHMERTEAVRALIRFFELKLINFLGYGIPDVAPSTGGIVRFLEGADFESLSRLKISKKDEEKLSSALQSRIRILLGNTPMHAPAVIENLEKLQFD